MHHIYMSWGNENSLHSNYVCFFSSPIPFAFTRSALPQLSESRYFFYTLLINSAVPDVGIFYFNINLKSDVYEVEYWEDLAPFAFA